MEELTCIVSSHRSCSVIEGADNGVAECIVVWHVGWLCGLDSKSLASADQLLDRGCVNLRFMVVKDGGVGKHDTPQKN